MRRTTRLLGIAAVLAVTLALMVPGSAFAVRRLAISSGSFKFDAVPGRSVDGSITVINDGDEPIKVMVYAADQKVDAQGRVTFEVPSRTNPGSQDQPSAWTQVLMPAKSKALGNIPYLEMAPKERLPIKFSVEVPSGVAPGDHNVMLFFEMFSDGQKGTGAAINGRLGSRIQLRVKGDLVERLDVARFAVPTFVIGDKVDAFFTLQNLGNVDQRVVADVQLLDRSDEAVTGARAIDNRLVFAGNSFEATPSLTATGALGQYTVRLNVVPVDEDGKAVGGGKGVLIEKRSVWLVPVWVPITAAVVIVLLLAGIVWTAGRKSAERKARKRSAAEAAKPSEPPADESRSA